MKMGKYLILRKDLSDGLTSGNDFCDTNEYYNVSYNNPFLRIVRKMDFASIIGLFLGKWKHELERYDVIIMFDNGYCKTLAKYIRRRNPKCRIILWFWNVIFEENEKYLSDGVVDEVWSYSWHDCEKYHLKHNTQFYSIDKTVRKNDLRWDLVFLGMDKGRGDYLKMIGEDMRDVGVKAKIVMPKNKEEYMKYDEYLDMVSKSKGILDAVNADNSGLTLRCMEALFFGKKLVTNNLDITGCDFYNSENVFILGKDDINGLKSFIDSPFKKVSKGIIEYYDFNNWLRRFEEEK